MTWGVSLTFLSLDQLPCLSFACSVCGVSLCVPYCECFCWHRVLLCTRFLAATPSDLWMSRLHRVCVPAHLESLRQGYVHIYQPSRLLQFHWPLIQISLPVLSVFTSFLHLYLSWSVLSFPVSVPVKCYVVYRQKTRIQCTYMLCCLCVNSKDAQ